MEVYRISSRLFLLLGIFCLVTTLQGVQGGVESEGPSESECRPYIEKALKELETAEAAEPIPPGDSGGESKEEEEVEVEVSTVEITTDDSDHVESDGDNDIEAEDSIESTESAAIDEAKEEANDDHSVEEIRDESSSEDQVTSAESETEEIADEEQSTEEHKDHEESDESPQSVEIEEATASEEEHSVEENEKDGSDDTDDKRESAEADTSVEDKVENVADEESVEDDKSIETNQDSVEAGDEEAKSEEDEEQPQGDQPETEEDRTDSAEAASAEETEQKSTEEEGASAEATERESVESTETAEQESAEATEQESSEATEQVSAERVEQESAEEQADASAEDNKSSDDADATASAEEEQSAEDAGADIVHDGGAGETEDGDSKETTGDAEAASESGTDEVDKSGEADDSAGSEDTDVKEDDSNDQVQEGAEVSEETVSESDNVKEEEKPQGDEPQDESDSDGAALEEMAGQDEGAAEDKDQELSEEEVDKEKEFTPEEELINEGEIPENLRPTDHLWQLLKLDDDNVASERLINGVAEITLRDLKKLYENAIKPLETLYKYRDLSNRHFGDAEIFSKPLVLFMGPWSGGKSSIINYLLNNEYNETSLRTGAEPSPAYFNILMYGEEPEVLDGTQLAADFTFSGLQKFGQGLEERLRGLKLPQKLLQKINIVEIPGILEVRKQISRVFPFNDACQWFIDRADIIYLVYDPSKLDVGPETEAILDQLKGREHQTRMILNKADQVKPEELMRVQGALIWNISPLMSSAQPPVMYTTSLWSKPYELGAPVRLLQAQERAFLRDLRSAVDKRIENKIASARRFAVRVRNHAKMVDCYLTTYYNHKSVFGNRKQVSDAIIEHPQDYHIYEGLSTLTNISRYDLPDPDVYRDFFRLNPLYDFQQLSATCTYFRGCPINRLDVAIAYDLPELVGKHKRMTEAALAQANLSQTPGS